MLLAIDIGNSTVRYGVFSQADLVATWHILLTELKDPTADHTALLLRHLERAGLKQDQVREVVVGSVVPRLTRIVEQATKDFFHTVPLVVTTDLDAGLALQYANPSELGVDRFVTAAMAYSVYRSDVIIVDLGTATTFSVVDQHGTYLGGAIAPGIDLSADVLADRTAQLPRVDLRPPRSPIGRDTVSGIQSGVLHGHAAMIDGMIDRMGQELGRTPKIIATGGHASTMAPLTRQIATVRPNLMLEGLDWLYRRLKPKEK